MKNFGLLLSFMLLLACSKEPVEVPQVSISGELSISDAQNLMEGETLRVGLFKGNSTSAQQSMALQTDGSGHASFAFSAVDEGAYQCMVYISEDRKPFKYALHTFAQTNFSADAVLPHATLQLIHFPRVQEQLFSGCIMCHGGSNGAEAGLYLTNDKSYAAIVNVSSTIDSTQKLVIPGNAAASFLVKVLRQSVEVEHDYSSTISETDIQLVEKWIDNGATNP